MAKKKKAKSVQLLTISQRARELHKAVNEQRADDRYNGKTFNCKHDYFARNTKKKPKHHKKVCFHISVKSQEACPFSNTTVSEQDCWAHELVSCNINDDKDCDLDNCKLKEFGRITVTWSK